MAQCDSSAVVLGCSLSWAQSHTPAPPQLCSQTWVADQELGEQEVCWEQCYVQLETVHELQLAVEQQDSAAVVVVGRAGVVVLQVAEIQWHVNELDFDDSQLHHIL